MHWLKEGDRNTKFFHSSTLKKRASSTIRELEDNQGNMIRDAAGLSSIIVSYYSSLFSSFGCQIHEDILQTIPTLVSEADNNMLLKLPTKDEVKAAVFGLSPGSAPGPDGFTGIFFSVCWETVFRDVIDAVRDFFLHGFQLY